MKREGKIKYLIIGNSAGGIGAAEAIREVDKVGTITIVSDEPYHVYSRPLISEYLSENYPIERMLFRQPDFYEKNNIQAILGQRVTGLNIDNHDIKLKDGRRITWEKLLLATGGLPITPKIEGIGLKGVFTFTTLDDAKAIDEFLNHYHRKVRATVIGGGLIGVSATEALVKRGVDVTIVDVMRRNGPERMPSRPPYAQAADRVTLQVTYRWRGRLIPIRIRPSPLLAVDVA